ncbi:MAG: IS110 family transposase [Actinomycetota bacterium]
MVSDPSSVTVGIDAAVVAKHRVVVRSSIGVEEKFSVPPTLAGLEALTKRLSAYRGALTVAEPTAMSWLALGHAVNDAGCGFALVETRHTAKLRDAISGRNKTDDVDASMLAASVDLFDLSPGELPSPRERTRTNAGRRHIRRSPRSGDNRFPRRQRHRRAGQHGRIHPGPS